MLCGGTPDKNNMIFARPKASDMPNPFIAHMFYYTAVFYLMSKFAPSIPTAKTEGFTAPAMGADVWRCLVKP